MTQNPLHDISTWLYRPGPSGIPSVRSAQELRGFVEAISIGSLVRDDRLQHDNQLQTVTVVVS